MAISTKTTFIVGAGASEPYGLPLASELAERARSLGPESPLVQLLFAKFGVRPVNEWLDDFAEQHITLDKFLQERHTYSKYTEIGKHVIAGLMGLALNPRATVEHDRHSVVGFLNIPDDHTDTRDWIEHVVDVMALGTNSLKDFETRNTGVQIVTFNFDTLIEDRVDGLLARRWPAEAASARAVRERCFPVHHVHGVITAPPATPPWTSLYGEMTGWRDWLTNAAAAIRSVHDEDIDQEVVGRAVGALVNSRVQMWLGLHYHQENLSRLGISGPTSSDGGRTVFGTGFGLLPGRRGWVARHVGGIQLGGVDRKCLDLLDDVDWQL